MDTNERFELSYLLSDKENNVLLKVMFGYCIYNIKEKNALIIEDDELETKIINKMIKNGNRICNSINDIENF